MPSPCWRLSTTVSSHLAHPKETKKTDEGFGGKDKATGPTSICLLEREGRETCHQSHREDKQVRGIDMEWERRGLAYSHIGSLG